VRLAFAVAAHMEPEILVVDEVLAVGDAEFQKKCLGRMSQVARGGRTVLFVSHNMAAVTSLCDRAILMERGTIRADGAPRDVVAAYLSHERATRRHAVDPGVLPGPRLLSIGLARSNVEYGGSLDIELELKAPAAASVAIEVEIRDAGGGPVVYASTAPMNGELVALQAGVAREVRLSLAPLPLASGDYTLHFWLIKPWTEIYHVFPDAVPFTVITSDPGRSGFEFRQDYGRGAVTIPLTLAAP
jgi:lipopolysaccharide transport system ATP-binding protein